MHSTPHLPHATAPPDSPSEQGRSRAAAQALVLRQGARLGALPPLLRGKHFGLVCRHPDSDDARAFIDAVSELGAQVSHINPNIAGLLMEHNAAATALWLGRLYDAIECQDLPAAIVARVRRHAGIPVLESVLRAEPAVGELLDGIDAAEAARRMLQGAVVVALD